MVRTLLLKLHLWLGLITAIFVICLSLTGSIMAFQEDIEHALHPGLWYVKPASQTMLEAQLIRTVEQRFAPARVELVLMPRQRNLAQAMRMTDEATVTISPYDGAILGRISAGGTTSERILDYIYQFHVSLIPNPQSAGRSLVMAGNILVWTVGIALCVQIPIGVILWWRRKRASVNWRGSWFRVSFDAHNAIGIYAALFLFIAAFTGVLTRFGEPVIVTVTNAVMHTSEPPSQPPVQSSIVPGGVQIGVEQVLSTARQSMPDATVAMIQLPLSPTAVFTVLMRVPEESSDSVHSSVFIDQYNGHTLRVVDFRTYSQSYRVIRLNRAIHTGDIWGFPSHAFVSFSSLLLVAMAVTGVVIGWKKLA
jgi:uncharacterized iron-regulated membrane protein